MFNPPLSVYMEGGDVHIYGQPKKGAGAEAGVRKTSAVLRVQRATVEGGRNRDVSTRQKRLKRPQGSNLLSESILGAKNPNTFCTKPLVSYTHMNIVKSIPGWNSTAARRKTSGTPKPARHEHSPMTHHQPNGIPLRNDCTRASWGQTYL